MRKISNSWILAGVLAGSIGYGRFFWLSAVYLLIIAYWLYFLRMIGAGDLKMMALICGFIGFHHGVNAIGVGTIICGGISVCQTWIRQLIQTKKRAIRCTQSRGEEVPGIPLGSYLCLGTICYLAWGSWKGAV